MKKMIFSAIMMITLGSDLHAQEPRWWVNADFVSTYIWRGLYISNASVQPTINYSTDGFTLGVWGSVEYDGYLETDLYATYDFDFGLSLRMTDYYLPSLVDGNDFFDIGKETGAHTFELKVSYLFKNLIFSTNYILNEAGEQF